MQGPATQKFANNIAQEYGILDPLTILTVIALLVEIGGTLYEDCWKDRNHMAACARNPGILDKIIVRRAIRKGKANGRLPENMPESQIADAFWRAAANLTESDIDALKSEYAGS